MNFHQLLPSATLTTILVSLYIFIIQHFIKSYINKMFVEPMKEIEQKIITQHQIFLNKKNKFNDLGMSSLLSLHSSIFLLYEYLERLEVDTINDYESYQVETRKLEKLVMECNISVSHLMLYIEIDELNKDFELLVKNSDKIYEKVLLANFNIKTEVYSKKSESDDVNVQGLAQLMRYQEDFEEILINLKESNQLLFDNLTKNVRIHLKKFIQEN